MILSLSGVSWVSKDHISSENIYAYASCKKTYINASIFETEKINERYVNIHQKLLGSILFLLTK